MWHQKKNEMFSDRVGGAFGSQGPHDGKNIVPAPLDVSDRDFLSESSRKRKSMDMDYPANALSVAASQSVLGSSRLNESKHQHKSDAPSSVHEQANTIRGLSNPPSFESDNLSQPVRYHDQSYSLTHVNKQNVPVAVADKMNNFHSSTQQEAFHQKGLEDIIKLLAGKIPSLPDLQSTSGNFFGQIEGYKHPNPDQTGTSMENTFSDRGSLGLKSENRNHNLNVNSSMDMCKEASELLRSSALSLNNRVSDHDMNFGERIHSAHTIETESSLERKLNEHTSYVGKNLGIATVGTDSLETAQHEGNVTEQSFLSYNTKVISSTRNNGVNSGHTLKDGNYGNSGTQNMESKEGSVMENGNLSTGEHKGDKSTRVLTGHGHGQGDDSQYVARTLDGKSKFHVENANSNTEKLWEGSIQLSTSYTTSAVAFFKSGEKAPEVAWSNSIVVKGKVRLEAFERFIQELPRARSRGLMVISLRWDAGSSKTGLEAMKQVAKGYKEGDKVGYAQISRAVDMYVCPRSDKIITILARYGFFKGMAALEEDQDSLIGCVVWRRNHSSSDSTSKKSKNKIVPLSEQSLSSAPSSATSVTETDNTLASVGISESKSSESKNIQLNEAQSEAVVVNRSGTQQPVPHSCPAIATGLNSLSQNNHMSSEVATPTMRNRGLENTQAGLEIPRPVHLVSPQNVTRENRPHAVDDDDNDDLPEFDFGAACGIVRHSVCKSPITSGNVSDAFQPGMQVPAPHERANSTGEHVVSTLPAQPAVAASQVRSQPTTLPVVSSGNQPSNRAKEFDEGKSFRPAVTFSDEKAITHDSERTVITNTGLRTRKNLWDDDDMPEWCPPDLEHQSRPITMSFSLPSVPSVPSPVPNPNPDNKLPGPPPPPPPRPPAEAAATRPSNSYMQAPVPNWKQENLIPGPPPTTNPRPPSSFLSSSDPNRMSENILPGPPPVRATSRPSENILPGPPPVRATSRPSFSYIASPMPNRNPENTSPGPPPRPRLPPPPPMPNRPQPHMGVNPSQLRPVSVQPPIGQSPSTGFTYISAPRPQANSFEVRPPLVRPPGWRGWQP